MLGLGLGLGLLVLLVAAELVARAVLADRVAAALEDSPFLSGSAADTADLDVGLGPWPVLPALLLGRLHSVTVGADDLTWQGAVVDVDIHLTDLHVRGARSADRTVVQVTIPSSSLGAVVSRAGAADASGPLAQATWSARDGVLVAQAQLERRSTTVPVEVSVAVSAADGALALRPLSVSVAGLVLDVRTLAGLGGSMAGLADTRTVAPDLPGDLVLTSAEVVGDSLVVEAEQAAPAAD
ncbi:hypothetical protein CSO01_29400 [Cellulomonas soli]|uniref:DUF2993 domain-containing protein n=1 Tax=Cellulomonas soli TaxID=931535 RepID=A0A512PG90_9CELL|nr:hypothetical protein CSO01_29400 [Cellulomonas soli]